MITRDNNGTGIVYEVYRDRKRDDIFVVRSGFSMLLTRICAATSYVIHHVNEYTFKQQIMRRSISIVIQERKQE